MPMSAEYIERLQIPQMVSSNTDNHETAFTICIDHVSTVTGISISSAALRRLPDPSVFHGIYVFGSLRCDCGAQLAAAMTRIEQEGRGIMLYMLTVILQVFYRNAFDISLFCKLR